MYIQYYNTLVAHDSYYQRQSCVYVVDLKPAVHNICTQHMQATLCPLYCGYVDKIKETKIKKFDIKHTIFLIQHMRKEFLGQQEAFTAHFHWTATIILNSTNHFIFGIITPYCIQVTV